MFGCISECPLPFCEKKIYKNDFVYLPILFFLACPSSQQQHETGPVVILQVIYIESDQS